MPPDFDFLDKLAGLAAAETLPRFRGSYTVSNKDRQAFDPVTEADSAAEAAIRRHIRACFPDHGIMGEEHGATGLDRDYVWVIDPIDGTRAFISGLPVWGTLVGLYRNGRACLGMMDQPFIGERWVGNGKLARYRGPHGSGALRVRACAGLGAATLFTTSPHLFDRDKRLSYERVEREVRLVRYGCDCYAYMLLAGGYIDLVIESGLKPYDIAGLIPVLEGAGAVVSDWRGGRAEKGGDIVAAANRKIHNEALRLLRPA